MAPTLQYETPGTAGLRVEEHADGGVTITVPTRRRNLAHVCATVGGSHLLGILAALPLWLAALLLATRRPRAVIRLTDDQIVLTETSDEGPGYRTTVRSWPRGAVELRPNRYGDGLYVQVPGKENFDALTDVPRPMIQHIGVALAAAQERLDGRRSV